MTKSAAEYARARRARLRTEGIQRCDRREDDPRDVARHQASVRRWLERHGYRPDGWLPGDVRELVSRL